MTLIEQIKESAARLSEDKQMEVLDFVTFLRQRSQNGPAAKPRSLKEHSAFGSWQAHQIDAVHYQRVLRDEWENS